MRSAVLLALLTRSQPDLMIDLWTFGGITNPLSDRSLSWICPSKYKDPDLDIWTLSCVPSGFGKKVEKQWRTREHAKLIDGKFLETGARRCNDANLVPRIQFCSRKMFVFAPIFGIGAQRSTSPLRPRDSHLIRVTGAAERLVVDSSTGFTGIRTFLRSTSCHDPQHCVDETRNGVWLASKLSVCSHILQ